MPIKTLPPSFFFALLVVLSTMGAPFAHGAAQVLPGSSAEDSSDDARPNESTGVSPHLFLSRAYRAKATSYYPANNRMEGGYRDRLGAPLYTLQDYLDGRAPYVSVAMDPHAFAYGTKLQIKELNQAFGTSIEFRVVDTGDAFKNKGRTRIDICSESRETSLNPLLNRVITLQPYK